METLEHWWNGLQGTPNRRDIWLRSNPKGPLWEIEVRQAGRSTLGEYATEQQARRILAALTNATHGAWQRVKAGPGSPNRRAPR